MLALDFVWLAYLYCTIVSRCQVVRPILNMEVIVNDCNARQSIYTAEDIWDVYNDETNPNLPTNWLTLGSIIRPTRH